MQSIDVIETLHMEEMKNTQKKKKNWCINIIKQYKKWKMINYDNITKENITQHNLNWARIPDHPYWLLIIEASRSGKTNALLNLVKQKMMMIILLLVKCICILKIQKMEFIDLIKNREKMDLKIWKIQRYLLNTQTICRRFKRILKSTQLKQKM